MDFWNANAVHYSLGRMVAHMETWADMEDGIPSFAWEDYKKALQILADTSVTDTEKASYRIRLIECERQDEKEAQEATK
jgi:hypothetical protein